MLHRKEFLGLFVCWGELELGEIKICLVASEIALRYLVLTSRIMFFPKSQEHTLMTINEHIINKYAESPVFLIVQESKY
jgi:hypothetical protein